MSSGRESDIVSALFTYASEKKLRSIVLLSWCLDLRSYLSYSWKLWMLILITVGKSFEKLLKK